MSTDHPVLWSYGPGFPFAKKVSYTAKDLPLETALDELLKQAGDEARLHCRREGGDK